MKNTCIHFAPHGSGILTAGYAMMDAYKDECWWCEMERLKAENIALRRHCRATDVEFALSKAWYEPGYLAIK